MAASGGVQLDASFSSACGKPPHAEALDELASDVAACGGIHNATSSSRIGGCGARGGPAAGSPTRMSRAREWSAERCVRGRHSVRVSRV